MTQCVAMTQWGAQHIFGSSTSSSVWLALRRRHMNPAACTRRKPQRCRIAMHGYCLVWEACAAANHAKPRMATKQPPTRHTAQPHVPAKLWPPARSRLCLMFRSRTRPSPPPHLLQCPGSASCHPPAHPQPWRAHAPAPGHAPPSSPGHTSHVKCAHGSCP